jgi:hypothetical protein
VLLSLLMTMALGFPRTSTRTFSHRFTGWSAPAIATPAALASGLPLHARLRASVAAMSSFNSIDRGGLRARLELPVSEHDRQKDGGWELRIQNRKSELPIELSQSSGLYVRN